MVEIARTRLGREPSESGDRASERLSNAAVIGGKGTANSGGCEANAAPSSRLRFCAPPGESGCPCKSLGSGATIDDVLVPGIVRCSGNCKRIVQLKRKTGPVDKGSGGRDVDHQREVLVPGRTDRREEPR